MFRTALCLVLVCHVLLATVECVNGFASDDARAAVESVTHADKTTRSLQAADAAKETLHDEREEHEERAPQSVVAIVEGGSPVLTKAAEVKAEVAAEVESLAKDKGLVDEATVNKFKTAVSGDDGFLNAVATDERAKRLMADGQTAEVPAKAATVGTSKDPVDETKADPAIVKLRGNGQTSEIPAKAEAEATRKYSVLEPKADTWSESEKLAEELARWDKALKQYTASSAKIKKLEEHSMLKVFLITQAITLSIILVVAAIASAIEQRNEAIAEAKLYA
ncbi:unnamed protein product [Hyaloperonospora brassicae]|uniref:RxLR effector candidate protein n=1 Tax=Hyaloperonospora brassicae TaxID=162125 RepID=A0AAV0TX15_HYABA|nr:unnamed protein product [Hyaloperonospora brassicae]